MVYSLTKEFPKYEIFGLTSQTRRAAVSIVANVAEGWLRRSVVDKRHFVEMAQGSLMELDTEIDVSYEAKYINLQEYDDFVQRVHLVNYLLDRYYKAIGA